MRNIVVAKIIQIDIPQKHIQLIIQAKKMQIGRTSSCQISTKSRETTCLYKDDESWQNKIIVFSTEKAYKGKTA